MKTKLVKTVMPERSLVVGVVNLVQLVPPRRVFMLFVFKLAQLVKLREKMEPLPPAR